MLGMKQVQSRHGRCKQNIQYRGVCRLHDKNLHASRSGGYGRLVVSIANKILRNNHVRSDSRLILSLYLPFSLSLIRLISSSLACKFFAACFNLSECFVFNFSSNSSRYSSSSVNGTDSDEISERKGGLVGGAGSLDSFEDIGAFRSPKLPRDTFRIPPWGEGLR